MVNMTKTDDRPDVLREVLRDATSADLAVWHAITSSGRVACAVAEELHARDVAAKWYRRQKAMQRHPSNAHLRVVLTGV